MTFEHSWGDGVAVLRYCNEVWEDATATPLDDSTNTADVPVAEALEWDLHDDMKVRRF